MASEPTKFVGKIDCPVCGENLHVRQNGRDTLNVSCICCGISSYAKGGTPAHGLISSWLRKSGASSSGEPMPPVPSEPVPIPEKPKPTPTQAAPMASIAKAVKGFNLGAL